MHSQIFVPLNAVQAPTCSRLHKRCTAHAKREMCLAGQSVCVCEAAPLLTLICLNNSVSPASHSLGTLKCSCMSNLSASTAPECSSTKLTICCNCFSCAALLVFSPCSSSSRHCHLLEHAACKCSIRTEICSDVDTCHAFQNDNNHWVQNKQCHQPAASEFSMQRQSC